MKTIFISCIITICSISVYGQGESRWTLVYEHDDAGKTLAGNIEELISAVRSGQPVRLGWAITHPTNKALKVEHVADAKFITIMSDTIVFAQIDPIVGQTPSIKDRFITLKENVEWAFSASTTGTHDSLNTNTKTGEIVSHMPFKCGLKWFVKK
jgi:hypothetical protein